MGIPISKAVWVLEALCIGCHLQVSGLQRLSPYFSDLIPDCIIIVKPCFYYVSQPLKAIKMIL